MARGTIQKLITEGQELGEIVYDDPDQLVEALMGCIGGLSMRMAYLGPGETRVGLPEPGIILRILDPHVTGARSR